MDQIIEITRQLDRLVKERDEYAKALSDSTMAYMEKIKELSTIKRMLDVMKFIPDRARVCREIVNIIIDETITDSCSLWLITESEKYLELTAIKRQMDETARYFEQGNPPVHRFEMGKRVVGRVATIGRTIFLKNIKINNLLLASRLKGASQAGSLLCLPIKDKEKVAGVLSLSHPEKNAFTGEIRRILDLAASQASVALVNLGMFERIQKLNHDLEIMIKQRTKQLDHQAHHDALTELPNRLLFDDRLEHSIARAQRDSIMLTVMFIDVSNFKRIIDGLGHSTGDWLLKKIANRLIGCLREVDTVSRNGGKEFAILLEDIVHENEAVIVARKLIKSLSEPFIFEDRELFLTVSAGLAFFPEDGQSGVDLVKNAVNAMRHAKELGKNNYQIFTRAMQERAIQRVELETDIRKAIQKNELRAYYQPRIDLKTMKVVGMEALIRWRRHSSGLVLPAHFIPVAEEIGFIVNIDEWILRAACEFTNNINVNGTGFSAKPLNVSVNLSARNFERLDLIETVQEAASISGLHPNHLELEVTESTIIRNMDLAIRILKKLRDRGFKVSVDDFGTGYSSLNYLTKFPLTTLKMDRSFVVDIPSNVNSRSIAKAIILMAKEMDVKVVAEGVETQDQLNFLVDHGCDEVQGYIFSPPVSGAEFRKLPADYKKKDSLIG
ncbi:diguanylate cyclase/phosphodiesterase (GGDEF & EAL domains) with PAS/PAC sensor(s) [hydrothermal vent metagenome]|uniref:Diguanylate cyclase/phosphodiesterase (GGDEF & EAL domains) with PAS/PAC sensor(S) n=1 Tax=hydrothermal vent metagenome TaxID=652676 RepID=A0A3B1CP55_9ZZZZ